MEAGLELFAIKRLLGHTSLSTTTKYLHVSREHLAKVRSPLDDDWPSEPPAARSRPTRKPAPLPPLPPDDCPKLAQVVSPLDTLPAH